MFPDISPLLEETQPIYPVAAQEDALNPEKTGAGQLVSRPHIPEETNTVSTQAAMVENATDGKDFTVANLVEKFTSYKERAGDDPNFKAIRDTIIQLNKNKEHEAVKGLIEGYIAGSDPIKLQNLLTNREALSFEVEKNASEKGAFAEAVVNNITDFPVTDLMATTQEYVKAKIANAQTVGEMFENEGWTSVFSEMAGLIIIPDLTKDIYDVTGKEGPEQFQKFIDAWSNYTPEEQIRFFPQLRDAVLPYMEGNKRKAAAFLQEFLVPKGGESTGTRMLTEAAFAAVDFVGIFKGLGALFKGANNTVKTLKELNEIEKAAELASSAISD